MKFVATIALVLLTRYLFSASSSRSQIRQQNSSCDTAITKDDGYKVTTTNYENGKKNGKEIIVLRKGDTSVLRTFKDDVLDGEEISYYPHNKVGVIGYYKGNIKVGIWKAFDTLGHLKSETFFNGKGLWPGKENFYRNNTIIFTQIWDNGRRTKMVIYDQRLYNEYKLTDISLGHKIFNEACSACHSLSVKIIGPPLYDVTVTRDREWLFHFVRDANDMVKKKDSLSNAIYNKYEKMEHPNYSYLTRGDIESVLNYIHTKK